MSENRSIISLSGQSLPEIAHRGIPVPAYDRSALDARILHVGVGGFHRAHMALYTDELAAAGSTWGIRGLGLLPGDRRMAEALAPQEHLYSLTEKGAGTFHPRIIGSIIDYQCAADDRAVAINAIADPTIAIMSLTITESGYAEPEAGERNTFDLLVEGLERRRALGNGPLTVLSCDNLPGNGHAARRATLAAAERHSAVLTEWITTNCTFPNSMVDRITPTTAPADREWLSDTYGVDDRWPVVGEPFRQWVIEDDFIAGRPEWERVGALFTDQVYLWELYKLRMLNAAHSCMAYLASLDGIVYVDEALARPHVRAYLEELLYTEAIPTLVEIEGHPREHYARTVLDRFASTGVRDQIARLCMDGTAKYPTFLIPTVVSQLERSGPIRCAALALAGWARYLGVTPEAEQAWEANPGPARAAAKRALDHPAAFLELDVVFPPAVSNNSRFRDEFVNAYHELRNAVRWTRD